MLKALNFVLYFQGKKILEFCEATKSYTPAVYDKILPTVVKCLGGWNCMTLRSFFTHSSLCLVTKMNLLKKSLSPQTVISLSTTLIWWNNSSWTQSMLPNFLFHYQVERDNFAEKNMNPIISFFSILLNV